MVRCKPENSTVKFKTTSTFSYTYVSYCKFVINNLCQFFASAFLLCIFVQLWFIWYIDFTWGEFSDYMRYCCLPSVLWHCWLGGSKGIRPVKNRVVGVGMVICLERGADLYMAQLMPLPLTVSCFSKIQIGFTFLVPAHPGSPGQRAVKWYVCMRYWWCVFETLELLVISSTLLALHHRKPG